MKKIILTSILILTAAPIFADDINMTPQNTFSGFETKTVQYPRLYRTYGTVDALEKRREIMQAKSVRQMKDVSPENMPMKYSQFPQNYDSSSTLRTQEVRNNMYNMFTGGGY